MRLSDCFIELIAYVAYFAVTAGKSQPPYERGGEKRLEWLGHA